MTRFVYGLSMDGTPFLMEYSDDGTSVMYIPPAGSLDSGALTQIALAECRQGLYGPDGVLIASCNDD